MSPLAIVWGKIWLESCFQWNHVPLLLRLKVFRTENETPQQTFSCDCVQLTCSWQLVARTQIYRNYLLISYCWGCSQRTVQDLCRRKEWDFALGISSGMCGHTESRISQEADNSPQGIGEVFSCWILVSLKILQTLSPFLKLFRSNINLIRQMAFECCSNFLPVSPLGPLMPAFIELVLMFGSSCTCVTCWNWTQFCCLQSWKGALMHSLLGYKKNWMKIPFPPDITRTSECLCGD